MKVVIPMAGRGSRFSSEGYATPKPLIEVLGKPMIAWALESYRDIAYSEMIFVALREHEEAFQLSTLLPELAGHPVTLILLDDVTEGQLCTVLAAKSSIDCAEDVLVGNADSLIYSEIGDEIINRRPECRGIISVINLPGERWSFAKTDESGRVVQVAEKMRISDHCSTGLYYFSSGHELVTIGEAMVREQEKTHGEYYVIPVYQKLIDKGLRVDISLAHEMWDMGTPQSLANFQKHVASQFTQIDA